MSAVDSYIRVKDSYIRVKDAGVRVRGGRLPVSLTGVTGYVGLTVIDH